MRRIQSIAWVWAVCGFFLALPMTAQTVDPDSFLIIRDPSNFLRNGPETIVRANARGVQITATASDDAGDETIEREVTVAGTLVDRPRMRKVIELAASKSAWGTKPRAGVARGFAANDFHGTCIAYVVEVTLRPSGQLPFTVERVVCAVDVGVAINPLGVEQQVESGILWSLSNMKGEITIKEGAIVESNFSDFAVAMIDETPMRIETHIVASEDERPHGLGEPTVCPFAPAVANALSRLTGRRVRRLPVRAADVVRA